MPQPTKTWTINVIKTGSRRGGTVIRFSCDQPHKDEVTVSRRAPRHQRRHNEPWIRTTKKTRGL